jgi:hypothetical protein
MAEHLSRTTVEPMADADELPAPNLEVARGLRELADFLEAHPALPEVHAFAYISEYRQRDARAELTALAEALGDTAIEEQNGSTVRIRGEFGPVKIQADAEVSDLRDEPPSVPEYEPIITRESVAL